MSQSSLSHEELGAVGALGDSIPVAPRDVDPSVVRSESRDQDARRQLNAAFDSDAELVIEPHRGWIPIDFKELWKQRELLYFLVWREVD